MKSLRLGYSTLLPKSAAFGAVSIISSVSGTMVLTCHPPIVRLWRTTASRNACMILPAPIPIMKSRTQRNACHGSLVKLMDYLYDRPYRNSYARLASLILFSYIRSRAHKPPITTKIIIQDVNNAAPITNNATPYATLNLTAPTITRGIPHRIMIAPMGMSANMR